MTTMTEDQASEVRGDRLEQLFVLLEQLELPDGRLSTGQLDEVARAVARRADLFEDLLDDAGSVHWSRLLFRTSSYEVKVLTWRGRQPVSWHDHGGSSGAMAVVAGWLNEQSRDGDGVALNSRRFGPGDSGSFGPDHLHDVNFEYGRPAISIHTYSPPLPGMTYYDRTRFGFVAREFIPEVIPPIAGESPLES
ncbi:MAG: cysteine dioxygenase family protein [Acidimicrobiales bacterium]